MRGLLVENKSGTQAIRAKVVIDATGDADVGQFTRETLRQAIRGMNLPRTIVELQS